jgi:hypothetical protein
MASGSRLTGTLLCRAGEDRVAFAAHEVDTIESPTTFGGRAGWASPRRAEEPGAHATGRILVASTGEAVGVDAVAIDAEPLTMLPAPRVLSRMAGGSLRGFIQVRGALWPVMSLVHFGRFLAPSAREVA